MELTSRERTELTSSWRHARSLRGSHVGCGRLLGPCWGSATCWAGGCTPRGLEWPSGPMALNVSPSDPTAAPLLWSLPPDGLQPGARPSGPVLWESPLGEALVTSACSCLPGPPPGSLPGGTLSAAHSFPGRLCPAQRGARWSVRFAFALPCPRALDVFAVFL